MADLSSLLKQVSDTFGLVQQFIGNKTTGLPRDNFA
jgi:hypothetical protein